MKSRSGGETTQKDRGSRLFLTILLAGVVGGSWAGVVGEASLSFTQRLSFDAEGFADLQLEFLWSAEGLSFSSTTVWDIAGFARETVGLGWQRDALALSGFVSISRGGFEEATLGAEVGWEALTLRASLTFSPAGPWEASLTAEFATGVMTFGGGAMLRPDDWSAKVWSAVRYEGLSVSGSALFGAGGLKGWEAGIGVEGEGYAFDGAVAVGVHGFLQLAVGARVDLELLELQWRAGWELVRPEGGMEALQVPLQENGAVRLARMEIGLVLILPPVLAAPDVPRPPVARIHEPRVRNLVTGQSMQFDASGSADPDGWIAQYVWEFGDGARALGRVAEHSYRYPGFYRVTLTVFDNSGLSDSHSITIHVKPPELEAGFTWRPLEPTIFDTVQFFDLSTGEVRQWLWEFGDGTSSTEKNPTHRYRRKGRYTVSLSITDVFHRTAKVSKVLVVVNLPPVADPGGPYEGVVGREIKFSALRSHDPDGRIARYLWDFGDGDTAEGPMVTHVYMKPGQYMVCLTVVDDEWAEARACTRANVYGPVTQPGEGR